MNCSVKRKLLLVIQHVAYQKCKTHFSYTVHCQKAWLETSGTFPASLKTFSGCVTSLFLRFLYFRLRMCIAVILLFFSSFFLLRMDVLHSTSILHGWKILLVDESWLNFNCTWLRWSLCHLSTENLDETLSWSVTDRLFVRVLEWFLYICIQDGWEFEEPEYTTMIWILLLQNMYK